MSAEAKHLWPHESRERPAALSLPIAYSDGEAFQ